MTMLITDLTGSHTFAYDALNRLTDATHPTLPTELFTYDRVGNRVTSHLSTLHRHNAANRLEEDATFIYTYDAAGNRASRTEKSTGAVTTYTYDGEHQLSGVTTPTLTATYRADGLGRRIEKIVNGVSTRFIYDQEDLLFEFDGTNTLTARWLHGPGIDEPLMLERDLNNNGVFDVSEQFFYHADGLGSILALTNTAGVVVESYRYDAFGQPTILAPDGSTRTCSAVGNPFLFTGREYDCESGLYFSRARTYDPRTGTFLQEDPVFSLNRYPYAENNPVNFVDPFGETAIAPSSPLLILLLLLLAATIAVTSPSICPLPSLDLIRRPVIHAASGEEGRNPAQDKKLSPGDLKKLKDAEINPERLKKELGAGQGSNLYKDKKGNIYVKPKGGQGPGEPTGININQL